MLYIYNVINNKQQKINNKKCINKNNVININNNTHTHIMKKLNYLNQQKRKIYKYGNNVLKF